MDQQQVRQILERVRAGELTPDEALTALRWAPFEDLGFAQVDTHRQLRTGYPEVVFCQGKTAEQVVAIVRRLAERSEVVLATRASPEQAEALRAAFPDITHHQAARVLELRQGKGQGEEEEEPQAPGSMPSAPRPSPLAPYVLVISAGTSDIPVAEEAAVTAQALGSRVERLYDVGVAGLHRLLDRRDLLLGANVLVVVAGMEGALPSVVGGLVERPVIAVPTSIGYGAHFGGLAALLGMLNSCATGLAVVNIDNGFGAGFIAHLINQPSGAAAPTSASQAPDQPTRSDAGRKAGLALGNPPAGSEPPPIPEGRYDHSPAIHRWESGSALSQSPVGTTETSQTPPPHGEDRLAADPAPTPSPSPNTGGGEAEAHPPTSVTVLEANLDDLNPQIYDHVMDRLFAAGALDVTLTPIHMKKNRPAVTLTVLCEPDRAEALADLLFAETTTLGLRMSRWERLCLDREWMTAETPWGPVRVKIGRRHGRILTRTPEYEDCKRLAREAGVPLKEVQAAALRAVTV